MSRKEVKAVTFDLWETLLFEKDGWNSKRTEIRCLNLAQILDRHGVEVSVEKLRSIFDKIGSLIETYWVELREFTYLDQIQYIIREANRDSIEVQEEFIEPLKSAYISAILEVAPYLNPETIDVLHWLKEQKMLVGLISNIGLTPAFALRKLLEKKGIEEYFDLMVFSDEIGLRKPNPKIFLRFTENFRLKPHEVIHIGDNLESDVWGAKNAGLRTIHFSNDSGRDRIAMSDPKSLLSISRKAEEKIKGQVIPDKRITSLSEIKDVIVDFRL